MARDNGSVTTSTRTQEFEGATFSDLVDAHVDEEWLLAETLRHLILATRRDLALLTPERPQP